MSWSKHTSYETSAFGAGARYSRLCPPVMLASYMDTHSSPRCSMFTARESGRGWPKAQGHCTHVGDKVLGSQIQTVPALAIMAVWRVNQ